VSHNVHMSGIPLKDMNILRRALGELNKEHGTKFELKLGAVKSRNYGFGGTGNSVLPNTVAVIHNPDLKYDISIQCDPKTKEYTVQGEALLIEPLMKAFNVNPILVDISTGQKVDVSKVGYRANEPLGMKAALGPITQRYALMVAEQQAAMAGQSCRRQVNKETGVITLSVAVN
jgi:hypothetical protein